MRPWVSASTARVMPLLGTSLVVGALALAALLSGASAQTPSPTAQLAARLADAGGHDDARTRAVAGWARAMGAASSCPPGAARALLTSAASLFKDPHCAAAIRSLAHYGDSSGVAPADVRAACAQAYCPDCGAHPESAAEFARLVRAALAHDLDADADDEASRTIAASLVLLGTSATPASRAVRRQGVRLGRSATADIVTVGRRVFPLDTPAHRAAALAAALAPARGTGPVAVVIDGNFTLGHAQLLAALFAAGRDAHLFL